MRILMALTSPYARKARAVVIEKKLACEMIAVSPWKGNDAQLKLNPLGKVPVLLTDDGTTVFDSRVICEYLDQQNDDPRLLPVEGAARLAAQVRVAMIEGAMDAVLMILMSQLIASDMQQSASWRQWLMNKADQTLDILETEISQRNGLDLSDISCFCFLDFWLFRMQRIDWSDWRTTRPQLLAWFERMQSRDCFVHTDPRNSKQ